MFTIYEKQGILIQLRESPQDHHPTAPGKNFFFRFCYRKRKVLSNHGQIQNIRSFGFVYKKCELKQVLRVYFDL